MAAAKRLIVTVMMLRAYLLVSLNKIDNENVTLHNLDVTETVATATRRAGGCRGGTSTQDRAAAQSSTGRTARTRSGREQKGVSTGKFF